MAKKKYIQKLTTKDIELLKAFSNVGYLTKGIIKDDLLVADRRIVNFERDGYVERVSFLDKRSKNADFAYRLTAKGKKLSTNQLSISYFYKSSSPFHDLALASKYFSLSKQDRENWITEGEWGDKFKEYIENLKMIGMMDKALRLEEYRRERLISPPDGGYIDFQGNYITVEIITSSYQFSDIEAKQNFCQTMGLEYNQIRI